MQRSSTVCLAVPRSAIGTLILLAVLLAAGCAHDRDRDVITMRLKDQMVPYSLAIGPFETTRLAIEGQPVDDSLGSSFREYFQAALDKAQVFDRVFVLDTPAEADDAPSADALFAAAAHQGGDFLLIGQIGGFEASLPRLTDFEYVLQVRVVVELYSVAASRRIWRKSDLVEVKRSGMPMGPDVARATAADIVKEVVIPSATAGLMPRMLTFLQDEHERERAREDTIFAMTEGARIEAELAPPKTLRRRNPHAYALVLGIEDYQRFPRVHFAKRDSEMVKQYLHQAMGYPLKNIALLHDGSVTRSQLQARVERWLPSVVANDPESEVFVYYGGHGTSHMKTGKAYLVPYDADLQFLEETAYSLDRLYDTLGALPAKQITVVLDSCFSGVGGRSILPEGARPMVITTDSPVTSQNLAVFTASGPREITSAYPEKRHGLFTYYFLKGLQGAADANHDNVVDFQEQYRFVRDRVETAAREKGREQTPQLIPALQMIGSRSQASLVRLDSGN